MADPHFAGHLSLMIADVARRASGYARGMAAVLLAAISTCRDDGPRPPVPVGIMWGSGATGAMVEDTVPLVVYYHDLNGRPIGWNDPQLNWASSNPAVLEILTESTAFARDTGVVTLTAMTTDGPADTLSVVFEVIPRWAGNLVWVRSPAVGANPRLALLTLPGHDVQQLADLGYPGAGSGDPFLTSNGRFLAAIASRPSSPLARRTIYVVDLNTGTKTAPFDTVGGNQFHPAWFPGDTLLAFLSDVTGAYEVFTARPDGSERQQRTQLGQRRPPSFAITPDNHLIISLQLAGEPVDLYETALSGTILARITNSPEEEALPAVSPDGSMLAYEEGPHVWVSRRDGSNRKRLVPDRLALVGYTPSPVTASSQAPSWTANSQFVVVGWDLDAFKQEDPPVYLVLGEIYAVRITDGVAFRLTQWPRSDASPFIR